MRSIFDAIRNALFHTEIGRIILGLMLAIALGYWVITLVARFVGWAAKAFAPAPTKDEAEAGVRSARPTKGAVFFWLLTIAIAVTAVSAWLSKPSRQSFRNLIYAREHARARTTGRPFDWRPDAKSEAVDGFVEACEFKDRVLWTTVELQGRTLYRGAFNRWFEVGTEQYERKH